TLMRDGRSALAGGRDLIAPLVLAIYIQHAVANVAEGQQADDAALGLGSGTFLRDNQPDESSEPARADAGPLCDHVARNAPACLGHLVERAQDAKLRRPQPSGFWSLASRCAVRPHAASGTTKTLCRTSGGDGPAANGADTTGPGSGPALGNFGNSPPVVQ